MLSIGNDQIALTVVPDFGARVTALTDKISGRQWLVTGPQSAQTGEDAVYGADEAVGWDECFPTVLSCQHPAWDGILRDHGALWGRKWSVDHCDDSCVETRYETLLFRFGRRLTVQGPSVIAAYRVTNLASKSLPYLWSQHCLLATSSQDRIILDGQESLRVDKEHFSWPKHHSRDLCFVREAHDGFALKAYAETPGQASAAIVGPNGGLCLDWNDVPAFGLWLCYGGWPKGNPVHQVALEPTTAGADHLADADADAEGRARALGPNETHTWTVRMTMTNSIKRTLQ